MSSRACAAAARVRPPSTGLTCAFRMFRYALGWRGHRPVRGHYAVILADRERILGPDYPKTLTLAQ